MCAFCERERACDFNKIANKLNLNVILNGMEIVFVFVGCVFIWTLGQAVAVVLRGGTGFC